MSRKKEYDNFWIDYEKRKKENPNEIIPIPDFGPGPGPISRINEFKMNLYNNPKAKMIDNYKFMKSSHKFENGKVEIEFINDDWENTIESFYIELINMVENEYIYKITRYDIFLNEKINQILDH